jgi:hypothetical protein
MYDIQHCFIWFHCIRGCWDRTKTVATFTLTARRSNHLARSHPHLARSHPHFCTFLHYHAYVETSSNYLVFCIFAGLKRVYLLFLWLLISTVKVLRSTTQPNIDHSCIFFLKCILRITMTRKAMFVLHFIISCYQFLIYVFNLGRKIF